MVFLFVTCYRLNAAMAADGENCRQAMAEHLGSPASQWVALVMCHVCFILQNGGGAAVQRGGDRCYVTGPSSFRGHRTTERAASIETGKQNEICLGLDGRWR